MIPPDGCALIGPAEMVLQEGECCSADFLFAPVVEGFDLGFATGLTEPEVFDFYAACVKLPSRPFCGIIRR